MTNAEHHANIAVGSSGLKLLRRSAKHFWFYYQNPDKDPEKETKAKRIGTATHCAVFEREEYQKRYIVLPDGLDRRSREGAALAEEFEADGLSVLTAPEASIVNGMAANALEHPITKTIFRQSGVRFETSIFVIDPVSGAPVKIRPDCFVVPCELFPYGAIVDGKTCQDASDEEFSRDAWNWEMLLQAALYCDVFQWVFKTKRRPDFMWLAMEKDEPHECQYFSATDAQINYGRVQYRPLLNKFSDCLLTGDFPGYSKKVRPLPLPAWAEKLINKTV